MLTLKKEAKLLEGPEGTAYIENEIIPKLREAIKNGPDRFREYHLWEDYDPEVRKRVAKQQSGGMTLRDRNKKPYEHRFGNTPIMYGGIQIGMMIARVPWLVPTAFEGLGLALNILPK